MWICCNDFDVADCNILVCEPPEPYPCGKKCCLNKIICSIALQEAALAHILNAEGEKIQKAVEISDDTYELLCVNKSVQETIKKVSTFEQVLLAKLSVALDNCECDDCCDNDDICKCLDNFDY